MNETRRARPMAGLVHAPCARGVASAEAIDANATRVDSLDIRPRQPVRI